MSEVHGQVWAPQGQSNKIHLSPDCRSVHQAKSVRKVDASIYPNRVLCKRCMGAEIDNGPDTPRNGYSDDPGTCGACGSEKEKDGSCAFCERFEEVLGPYA